MKIYVNIKDFLFSESKSENFFFFKKEMSDLSKFKNVCVIAQNLTILTRFLGPKSRCIFEQIIMSNNSSTYYRFLKRQFSPYLEKPNCPQPLVYLRTISERPLRFLSLFYSRMFLNVFFSLLSISKIFPVFLQLIYKQVI